MGNRKKLLQFLRPDPAVAAAKSPSSSSSCSDDEDNDDALSPLPSPMATPSSTQTSTTASPYAASPWINLPGLRAGGDHGTLGTPDLRTTTGLLGSLVKPDGHVYSLAASGDLLYTGTDSKNVRVWRGHRESSAAGFRCGSGLVKAIVISPSDGRIFTGHQDGKIRVWLPNSSSDNNFIQHKRVGSLPRLGDYLRSSVMPSRYVETGRRRKSCVWLRHFDAVSCLSLDAAAGVLYSGSWDRSFKAWRVSDSRCLESMVHAHDDAVNAVAVAGFDALVFTGSADGSVKVWRREHLEEVARKKKGGKTTRHVMERVLRKGDSAVNGIAVCVEARVVYVGSSDGAVTHWQWRRGGAGGNGAPPRNGGVLRGHGNMAVLCVAVAGGRVVASGGADRTVCVWRRDEGAQHSKIAVLKGHAGPVKCVAMDQEQEEEEDGHRRWVVYSGSLDGSVKVWRVSDAPDADTTMPTPTPAREWNGSPSPGLAAGTWTPSSRLRG